MTRLSDRSVMSEGRRIKTLMMGRAVGGGAGGVALPQPTAQNQMLIADATPAWALLAAPTAQYQVPIAGANPYTPVWAALTIGDISDLAYTTPALTLSTANAEGSADTVIRSNATILVFDATVPDIIQPDDAAATGAASVAARRDHTHGIVCVAPASPSVSLAASVEGSGTSFTRADHTHQLDQSITPTWTGVHTHAANVIFDDGAGDSPQLQFVGGSNDDTALMFLDDDATGGDSDLVIRLCAADTGSQLIIQDSSPATVAYVDADGNADFEGHLAVGATAAISANNVVTIEETFTNTSGTRYGVLDKITIDPASTYTSTIYAFSTLVIIDSAETQSSGSIVGGNIVTKVAGGEAATVNKMIGARYSVDAEDATLVGQAQAIQISMPDVDTGTLTDSYGLFVPAATIGAGNIVNQYGIYMENISGADTLNYTIYTNVGLVHFGDQVEIIGSAAVDVQLIVTGAAAQSASLVQFQNSDTAVFFDSGDGLAASAVVWNEQGLDIDYRIEARGEVYAFFIQGSDGNIGLRTVPSYDVHIKDCVFALERASAATSSFSSLVTGDARFRFYMQVDGAMLWGDGTNLVDVKLYRSAADTLRLEDTFVVDAGITLNGASGANVITVPDNLAQAAHLVDAGGIEYLRIISTDAQPVVVFNEGGADIDHHWEARGEANALFVQGSDGKIGIWTATLNARVEIGGAAGPAILNLPTNVSTIDAGLSSRDIADECIITFGANVRSIYTGRIVQARAGACVRIDTRDEDGGGYPIFQVLTRAAGVADGTYDIPFKIGAGAPTNSLFIDRAGYIGLAIIPTAFLHLDGAGVGDGILLTRGTLSTQWSASDNGPAYFGCASDDDLILITNALTRITIAAAGTITIPDLAGANQPVGADAAGLLYVPHASDRKFKQNIKPLTGGLDIVRALRGVTFDWRPDALAEVGLDFGECRQQIGLIAQEVVEVIPQSRSDGKEYKSYRRDAIVPYLIEAIKELDQRITKMTYPSPQTDPSMIASRDEIGDTLCLTL